MINMILKCGKNKSDDNISLTQTIEDVYFISIEGEIILNTLDKWEAYYLYDLTIKGHDFYKNFGGKFSE